VDSAWEQYKLEARKLLVNCADSHLSSARGVGLRCLERDLVINRSQTQQDDNPNHKFTYK
jgi:hypothetical protein